MTNPNEYIPILIQTVDVPKSFAKSNKVIPDHFFLLYLLC